MENEYFDSLKGLVGRGEIAGTLEQLLPFLKDSNRALYDIALSIMGDLAEIDRFQLTNPESNRGLMRARAPLRPRLLALINEASRASVDKLPVPPPPLRVAEPVPARVPRGTEEKLIGADRMMSLAWIRRGLTIARAVCRVETPNGLGTGFLVEGGVLVTNHHVLPDEGVAERSFIAFNFEEDESGNLMFVHRYKLVATKFRTNPKHDCTAVRVGEAVGSAAKLADWGFLKLRMQPPKVGDFVSIIQHPGGSAKKIALSENQVVNVPENTNIVQYTTDTLPGSSGSPVLDDNWNVVAIHHAGGNLSRFDGTEDTHYTNEGILSAAVHKAVLA